MTLFVAAVLLVAAVLAPGLAGAFMSNPFLNGLIILVAIVGAAYTFRSVLILRPEIDWLESYQAQRTGRSLASTPAHPKLLAPLAKMLGERPGRISMSAMAIARMSVV